MRPSFAGKSVLITGGTKGIGLATALEFARCGARCVVTYRWGSVEEEEIAAKFREEGLPVPLIVQANAASPDDTKALMAMLKGDVGPIHAFVSNAANAVVVKELDDYTRRGFLRTMEASTWPTFDYLFAHNDAFGCYPRYAVVMSSNGADHFAVGYDFVAASKAALEALCRYMSYRLREEGCSINVVRSRGVRTDAMQEVFGDELDGFAEKFVDEGDYLDPSDVAGITVSLCSGMLDGMNGQVITADKGTTFEDNIMGLFERREHLEL